AQRHLPLAAVRRELEHLRRWVEGEIRARARRDKQLERGKHAAEIDREAVRRNPWIAFIDSGVQLVDRPRRAHDGYAAVPCGPAVDVRGPFEHCCIGCLPAGESIETDATAGGARDWNERE